MESTKTTFRDPITLVKTSFNALINHPIILFPFFVSVFIQLVVLEFLYFSARFPLVVFFGPIIRRLWGEGFLHYPLNIILLPKLFYYAQLFVYIFIGAFLTAVAALIIRAINNERKITFQEAVREAVPYYIHIFTASLIFLGTLKGFYAVYDIIFKRALLIRSKVGIFGFIKAVLVGGAPYYQFFIAILVTALFAFLIPVIVIERKKIFAALIENFKRLQRLFIIVFIAVFLPMLLYIPVLLLRNSVSSSEGITLPEIHVLIVVVGVFVTLFIDAIALTAVTTLYLADSEKT